MNDLVRPTALFGGARVPAVGPSGVLGSVPNPPPQVAQLPVGSTLTGVVVGHDAAGHTLVRTDLGTLSVATKTQLPVNSEVTLQIRSSGGQLHVLIMHSELPHGGAKGASAPQQPLAAGAQAGGAGPQGQTATAPGGDQAGPVGHGPASDLLTLGQTLRAVVQSPASTPNAASGGIPGGAQQPAAAQALSALAAQLAPGSELQLRITSVQAPAAQTAGTQAAASPTPSGPASGAPTPGPQGPTTPGSAAPSAATPGTAPPGATAPGVPGGAPDIAGRIAAYGALQGGAGQAAPPTAAGATPNGPNPAAATPQAAAPAVAPGQGTAAGSGNAPAPAAVTPASGVPASGALASYAAASGASGATAQGPGAAATPSALVAAQGIGQGSGQGGGPVAPAQAAQAAQSGAAPGTNTANAPNSASAAASTNPGAGSGPIQFTGSVTAVTHAGRPVVQTPLGTLTLEIRAPLQAGSRMTFELPGGALPSGYPGAAAPGPAALGTLAHSWPALEETLRALQEVAPPGVAAATLQEAVPQPGSRLASGLLFFLSALGAGDVTRWIGNQASQALRGAGRDSLLSRLGQDFSQLGRLADNQGGDWRLFFMPLYDGDQLRQLRLFLRHGQHEQDGGDGQDDEDQTRFVVEVEMTRLGDLQLDGLVREKRLDLILRSRAPLPDFMRRDIMQIFHDANQITGYQGNLGFQSSLEWKAMPIAAPEAAEAAGVVV
jgi:hypothetical protein